MASSLRSLLNKINEEEEVVEEEEEVEDGDPLEEQDLDPTNPSTIYKLRALIDAVDLHHQVNSQLLIVAIRRLASELAHTERPNYQDLVSLCYQHGIVERMLQVLGGEYTHVQSTICDALRVLSAILQSPDDGVACTHVLFQKNIVQVLEVVARAPTHGERHSSLELSIDLLLHLSHHQLHHVLEEGGVAFVMSTLEKHHQNEHVLSSILHFISYIYEQNQNEQLPPGFPATLISHLQDYCSHRSQSQPAISNKLMDQIVHVFIGSCYNAEACHHFIVSEGIIFLASTLHQFGHNHHLMKKASTLTHLLFGEDTSQALRFSIDNVVSSVQAITKPGWSQDPVDKVYSALQHSINSITLLILWKSAAREFMEYNGIIAITAACLVLSDPPVLLCCIRAIGQILSIRAGGYVDAVLLNGGLKALLHAFQLIVEIKSYQAIVQIGAAIEALTDSSHFHDQFDELNGMELLSNLLKAHEKDHTIALTVLRVISKFSSGQVQGLSYPIDTFESIVRVKLAFPLDASVQTISSKCLIRLTAYQLHCNQSSLALSEKLHNQILHSFKPHAKFPQVLIYHLLLLTSLSFCTTQKCSALKDRGIVQLIARALYVDTNMSLLRSSAAILIDRVQDEANAITLMDSLKHLTQQIEQATQFDLTVLMEKIEHACSVIGLLCSSPVALNTILTRHALYYLGAIIALISPNRDISAHDASVILTACSFAVREIGIGLIQSKLYEELTSDVLQQIGVSSETLHAIYNGLPRRAFDQQSQVKQLWHRHVLQSMQFLQIWHLVEQRCDFSGESDALLPMGVHKDIDHGVFLLMKWIIQHCSLNCEALSIGMKLLAYLTSALNPTQEIVNWNLIALGIANDLLQAIDRFGETLDAHFLHGQQQANEQMCLVLQVLKNLIVFSNHSSYQLVDKSAFPSHYMTIRILGHIRLLYQSTELAQKTSSSSTASSSPFDNISALCRELIASFVTEKYVAKVVGALEAIAHAFETRGPKQIQDFAIDQKRTLQSIEFLTILYQTNQFTRFLARELNCSKLLLTLCQFAASYVDIDDGKMFHRAILAAASAAAGMEAQELNLLCTLLKNCIMVTKFDVGGSCDPDQGLEEDNEDEEDELHEQRAAAMELITSAFTAVKTICQALAHEPSAPHLPLNAAYILDWLETHCRAYRLYPLIYQLLEALIVFGATCTSTSIHSIISSAQVLQALELMIYFRGNFVRTRLPGNENHDLEHHFVVSSLKMILQAWQCGIGLENHDVCIKVIEYVLDVFIEYVFTSNGTYIVSAFTNETFISGLRICLIALHLHDRAALVGQIVHHESFHGIIGSLQAEQHPIVRTICLEFISTMLKALVSKSSNDQEHLKIELDVEVAFQHVQRALDQAIHQNAFDFEFLEKSSEVLRLLRRHLKDENEVALQVDHLQDLVEAMVHLLEERAYQTDGEEDHVTTIESSYRSASSSYDLVSCHAKLRQFFYQLTDLDYSLAQAIPLVASETLKDDMLRPMQSAFRKLHDFLRSSSYAYQEEHTAASHCTSKLHLHLDLIVEAYQPYIVSLFYLFHQLLRSMPAEDYELHVENWKVVVETILQTFEQSLNTCFSTNALILSGSLQYLEALVRHLPIKPTSRVHLESLIDVFWKDLILGYDIAFFLSFSSSSATSQRRSFESQEGLSSHRIPTTMQLMSKKWFSRDELALVKAKMTTLLRAFEAGGLFLEIDQQVNKLDVLRALHAFPAEQQHLILAGVENLSENEAKWRYFYDLLCSSSTFFSRACNEIDRHELMLEFLQKQLYVPRLTRDELYHLLEQMQHLHHSGPTPFQGCNGLISEAAVRACLTEYEILMHLMELETNVQMFITEFTSTASELIYQLLNLLLACEQLQTQSSQHQDRIFTTSVFIFKQMVLAPSEAQAFLKHYYDQQVCVHLLAHVRHYMKKLDHPIKALHMQILVLDFIQDFVKQAKQQLSLDLQDEVHPQHQHIANLIRSLVLRVAFVNQDTDGVFRDLQQQYRIAAQECLAVVDAGACASQLQERGWFDFDEVYECLLNGAEWKESMQETTSQVLYYHVQTRQTMEKKPREYDEMEKAIEALCHYLAREGATVTLTPSQLQKVVIVSTQILQTQCDLSPGEANFCSPLVETLVQVFVNMTKWHHSRQLFGEFTNPGRGLECSRLFFELFQRHLGRFVAMELPTPAMHLLQMIMQLVVNDEIEQTESSSTYCQHLYNTVRCCLRQIAVETIPSGGLVGHAEQALSVNIFGLIEFYFQQGIARDETLSAVALINRQFHLQVASFRQPYPYQLLLWGLQLVKSMLSETSTNSETPRVVFDRCNEALVETMAHECQEDIVVVLELVDLYTLLCNSGVVIFSIQQSQCASALIQFIHHNIQCPSIVLRSCRILKEFSALELAARLNSVTPLLRDGIMPCLDQVLHYQTIIAAASTSPHGSNRSGSIVLLIMETLINLLSTEANEEAIEFEPVLQVVLEILVIKLSNPNLHVISFDEAFEDTVSFEEDELFEVFSTGMQLLMLLMSSDTYRAQFLQQKGLFVLTRLFDYCTQNVTRAEDMESLIDVGIGCLATCVSSKLHFEGNWQPLVEFLFKCIQEYAESLSRDDNNYKRKLSVSSLREEASREPNVPKDYLESVVGILTRLAVQQNLATSIADTGLNIVICLLIQHNNLPTLSEDQHLVHSALLALVWQLCFFVSNVSMFLLMDGMSFVVEQLTLAIGNNDEIVLKCLQILHTICKTLLESDPSTSIPSSLFPTAFPSSHAEETHVQPEQQQLYDRCQQALAVINNTYGHDPMIHDLARVVKGDFQPPVAPSSRKLLKAGDNPLDPFRQHLSTGQVLTCCVEGKKLHRDHHVSCSEDLKQIVFRLPHEDGLSGYSRRRDEEEGLNATQNEIGTIDRIVALRTIRSITNGHGKHHRRRWFFNPSKAKAASAKCFNIVTFEGEEYGFECHSILERKRWVDALTALVQHKDFILHEATSPRSRGLEA